MAIRPNTTCDIYRTGNAPPAAPDVAAVPCWFTSQFDLGRERGEKEAQPFRFTAWIYVDSTVDIRDAFAAWTQGNRDKVYIPDQNGVGYNVNFVERVLQGQPNDHKIVYIDRLAVNWPFPGIGGAGQLNNAQATLSGSGSVTHNGSGNLVNASMTLSGTATIGISGSGSLTIAVMQLDGSGSDTSGGPSGSMVWGTGGSYTWTVPPGVTSITIICTGGGGS